MSPLELSKNIAGVGVHRLKVTCDQTAS